MKTLLRTHTILFLTTICTLFVWLTGGTSIAANATLPPTRTPAAPAQCPRPTGRIAAVTGSFWDDNSASLLATPLLDYLNIHGSPEGLEAALHRRSEVNKVQVIVADVTGDRVGEVLVAISIKDTQEVDLFIIGCQAGQYVSLYSQSLGDDEPAFTPFGFLAIQDLNGDGVADIVYASEPVKETVYFDILEWNGSQFVELDPSPNKGEFTGISERGDAFYSIRDHGDGTREFVIQNLPSKDTHYGGSITERLSEVVYAWNGSSFAWYCQEAVTPAQYRVQTVQDGDSGSRCGHYDKAMLAYENAIFDSSLLPWTNAEASPGPYGLEPMPITPAPSPDERDERAIMEAYARYRIIVLHALQGQQHEAQADYDILQQKFPTSTNPHPIAELAATFWQAYGKRQNLAMACQQAIAYTQGHPDLIALFEPYQFYSQGGSTGHVFGFVPDPVFDEASNQLVPQARDPPDVCPFK